MNPTTAAREVGRRRRVTIIGGGVWVASLVEVLSSRSDLPELDLRLVARRAARSGVICTHLRRRLARRRPDWSIEHVEEVAPAVRGADLVVVLVRVGGSEARRHDEQFPTPFGLIGDEGIGVGGIANAMRTAPVMTRLAEVLRVEAPDAIVLNMVAPLGLTTRLLRSGGIDALGICELPTTVADRLRGAGFDVDDDGVGFGGLNHLSWYWAEAERSEDLGLAAARAGLVDPRTWDEFSAVPMPYYFRVLQPSAGRSLGIAQPAGRADALAGLAARAMAEMQERPGAPVTALAERSMPWFDQALVPAMAALMGGSPHVGPVNLAQRDTVRDGSATGRLRLLGDLPDDLVVEVRARVGTAGVQPLVEPPPPEPVVRFLARWAHVDDLVHAAALEDDPTALDEAVSICAAGLDRPHRDRLVDAVRAGVTVGS